MTEDFEEKIRAVQRPEFYGKNYFDEPKDVYTESGYDRYSPNDSGIHIAARVVLSYFGPRKVLDVGCAKGFLVQMLRENGIDGWGVDISRYAIETAPESVRKFLHVGTVLNLEFDDDSFDLVTCIETLEHLHPDKIDKGASELCRVTSDKLFLAIPSIGHNEFGPDAGPAGKVKPSAIELYKDEQKFREPVPISDLVTDKHGFPLEGHLTLASFAWWTSMFAKYGFSRRGDIEELINKDELLVNTNMWNIYVFEKPYQGTARDVEARRHAEETTDRLRQCGRLFVHSLVGETTEDPGAEAGRAVSVSPEHGPGYPLYGPYIPLPQGEYKVVFRLRLGRVGSQHKALDWIRAILGRCLHGGLEIATIDVVSGADCKVHASRIISRSAFRSPQCYEPLSLTFLSHGEDGFQFRVYSFGREPFCIDHLTPFSLRRHIGEHIERAPDY